MFCTLNSHRAALYYGWNVYEHARPDNHWYIIFYICTVQKVIV